MPRIPERHVLPSRVGRYYGKMRRSLFLSTVALVSLCLMPSQTAAQAGVDIYQTFKKTTAAQAESDPLIGIWSGSMCTKRIVLAVVRNDEQNGFALKAVLLNGKEVGYGFKNADPWFYVSPLAAPGVYEGKTVYRNRFFKNWFPNRIVLNSENVFSATDDAVGSCGSPTNVYVRKEARPRSASEPVAKGGSGFLIHQTDLVLTAYHVVKSGSQIAVRFPSGTHYAAQIVGRDVNNDLAILKLSEFKPSDDGFRINSQLSLSAGDSIHALGFPLTKDLGERPSIVSGAVSSTTGLDDSPTQFRMTALVNPGNSGGPILNQNGDVVGVVVAALVGSEISGINFAVKISAALPLLQQVGLRLDDKGYGNPMTASELFAAFSKNVVLVKASAQ